MSGRNDINEKEREWILQVQLDRNVMCMAVQVEVKVK